MNSAWKKIKRGRLKYTTGIENSLGKISFIHLIAVKLEIMIVFGDIMMRETNMDPNFTELRI